MGVLVYARTTEKDIHTVVSGLRTPGDKDGTLDKESTSSNDIFDAFRLVQVLPL
jgi:hypothetical protein